MFGLGHTSLSTLPLFPTSNPPSHNPSLPTLTPTIPHSQPSLPQSLTPNPPPIPPSLPRLVCTGALTNAALLLALYPEAAQWVELVLMGGAMGVGNTGEMGGGYVCGRGQHG